MFLFNCQYISLFLYLITSNFSIVILYILVSVYVSDSYFIIHIFIQKTLCTLDAHNNQLACIAFNLAGNLLSTASIKVCILSLLYANFTFPTR